MKQPDIKTILKYDTPFRNALVYGWGVCDDEEDNGLIACFGPESINDEEALWDKEYYGYVPDDVFWNYSDDDFQKFINEEFN